MRILSLSAIRRLKGAALSEYGLLAGLIAVVAIFAISSLGQKTSSVFSVAEATISSSIATPPATGGTSVTDTTPTAPQSLAPVLVGVGDFSQVLYSDTTNTLDLAYPSAAQPGDFITAVVLSRSKNGIHDIAIPAGWTRKVHQDTQDGYYAVSVLTKTYQAGDGGSETFTLDIDHQISGQMFAFDGTNLDLRAIGTAAGTTASYQVPDFTSAGDNSFAMAIVGQTYVKTSQLTTITGPAGWTQTTPQALDRNRLAIAYTTLANAGDVATGVGFTSDVDTYNWKTIGLQVYGAN